MEFLNNISSSSERSNLKRSVQFNEFTNGKVSAANTNNNHIAFLNLDINSALSESVNTFRFSKEHDLHFTSFRIGIDKLGQCSINFIEFVWNI